MFLSFLAYKSTPLLFSITKPRRARVALQIMPRFSTYLYSWQYLVFYIKIIGTPQGKRVQVANEKSDDPHQLPLHPKVSQDQLFSLCTLLKFPNIARIWAGLREHILQSRDSGTTFLRAQFASRENVPSHIHLKEVHGSSCACALFHRSHSPLMCFT